MIHPSNDSSKLNCTKSQLLLKNKGSYKNPKINVAESHKLMPLNELFPITEILNENPSGNFSEFESSNDRKMMSDLKSPNFNMKDDCSYEFSEYVINPQSAGLKSNYSRKSRHGLKKNQQPSIQNNGSYNQGLKKELYNHSFGFQKFQKCLNIDMSMIQESNLKKSISSRPTDNGFNDSLLNNSIQQSLRQMVS